MTNKQQIMVGSVDRNQKNSFIKLFHCFEKIAIENTKKLQIRNLRDWWYFNMKHNKNKIIIVVQYTMVNYVYFYKQ